MSELRIAQRRGRYLGFPHDLAPRPYPDDEDELLAFRLLVVRVLHADIREGCLRVVEMLAQLFQAPRAGRGQLKPVRAIGLGRDRNV